MANPSAPLALRVFDRLFQPWMRRRIRAIRFAGLPAALEADRPLIVVANHVSWWDGFLLREVHRAIRPAAPLYTVMLRESLDRRPYLRPLGALPMDPTSATSIARVIRSLRIRLIRHPDAVVLFFPQGRIWPSHRRPLGFQPGIELFTRQLPPLDLLPVGIHIEPLCSPAPTAFLSAGAPRSSTGPDAGAASLERVVEDQLDSILAFLARHGEDAGDRWPPDSSGALEPLRAAP